MSFSFLCPYTYVMNPNYKGICSQPSSRQHTVCASFPLRLRTHVRALTYQSLSTISWLRIRPYFIKWNSKPHRSAASYLLQNNGYQGRDTSPRCPTKVLRCPPSHDSGYTNTNSNGVGGSLLPISMFKNYPHCFRIPPSHDSGYILFQDPWPRSHINRLRGPRPRYPFFLR